MKWPRACEMSSSLRSNSPGEGPLARRARRRGGRRRRQCEANTSSEGPGEADYQNDSDGPQPLPPKAGTR